MTKSPFSYIAIFLLLITTGFANQPPHLIGVNLSGAENGSRGATYGSDYVYPSATDFGYYKSRGLELVRIPFKWEHLQPTLYGELDSAELARLDATIDLAEEHGMLVIPDLHNYGRYDGTIVGTTAVPRSAFADFWSKLAAHLEVRDSIWGLGIMNEPHDMNSYTWFDSAQDAVDAIRLVNTRHAIIIPGEAWSSGAKWLTHSADLINIADPENNLVFEAHQYLGKDSDGVYSLSYDGEGGTPTIGVDRLTNFVNWCNTNNVRGLIGEIGVPDDDSRWITALDNTIAYLDANNISVTYWLGGYLFNSRNELSMDLDPQHKERPQMTDSIGNYAQDIGTRFWPHYYWYRDSISTVPGEASYHYSFQSNSPAATVTLTPSDTTRKYGSKSTRFDYTIPSGGGYGGGAYHISGGINLADSFIRDHHLSMWIRGTYGSSLKIKMISINNATSASINTSDYQASDLNGSSWQLISIPLSDFTDTDFDGSSEVHTIKFDCYPRDGTSYTFRFDDLKFDAPHTNQAPTISLDSPSAGNVYAGQEITLSASANDSDGSIDYVEFLADGKAVGYATAAPYEYSITFDDVGSSNLTAIAFDNYGKPTRSAVTTVDILPGYGPELITNGDFESGDVSWDGSHTIVSTESISGSHSLRHNMGSSDAGRQRISTGITEGKTYQIKGWVKTDATLSGSVRIYIKWQTASNQTISQGTLNGHYVAPGSDWTLISEDSAVAPAGASKLYILLKGDTRTGGYAYFDDISVKEKL
jgi:endoglucanase